MWLANYQKKQTITVWFIDCAKIHLFC